MFYLNEYRLTERNNSFKYDNVYSRALHAHRACTIQNAQSIRE